MRTTRRTRVKGRYALDLRGTARIQGKPSEGKKKRTFDIIGYTGVPLESQGCYGWECPVVVELSGIILGNECFPILDNHGPAGFSDQNPKSSVVGQSTTARIQGGNLRLTGTMFETEASREIIDLADQGLKWQASIGAKVLAKEFIGEGTQVEVNGQMFDGPIYVARKTKLREVSFVVLGDDSNTSALVAAYRRVRSQMATKVNGRNGKNGKRTGTDVRANGGGKKVNIRANRRALMRKPTRVRAEDSDRKVDADDADFRAWCKAEGYGDPDGMTARMCAKVRAEYDESADDDEDDEDEDKKAADASDDDDVDADDSDTDVDADGDDEDTADRDAPKGARAKAKANAALDLRAESSRIAGIQAACAGNANVMVTIETATGRTKKVSLAAHAIEAGWTVKKVKLEMIRATRQEPGPFWYSASRPEIDDAVIEAALLEAKGGRNPTELAEDYFYKASGTPDRQHDIAPDLKAKSQRAFKARYTDKVLQAAHDLFGNSSNRNSLGQIGLQRLLILAARSRGYRGDLNDINPGNLEEVLRAAFSNEIRAEGGSAISLQNVLANVLNKYLLYGYFHTDMSWREIGAVRPVKDFKPTKGLNLTGDFLFTKLNADGQITHGALTDEAYANQIDTFARMLGITRQTIINDDTSILTTVPMLMGIGCNDSISKLFWTLLLNPPVWTDSNAFFFNRTTATTTLGGGAINSNIVPSGGSSALSSSSLQTGTQLFDKQVKPNGQPLGVRPAILAYPPELDVTALELMQSENLVYGGASAAKQPQKNVWKGRYKPVMSPYISNSAYTGNSTTQWFLFADPNRLPAIEMAFLNGQETPTVQTAQANFNQLGIDVRGFHDYGVAMQNPRGAVKSPGA
jgi:hypothetical protein